MLSIWTSVISFWEGRGNTMLKLLTKVKRIYIYIYSHLKGKRVAMWPVSPTPNSTKGKADKLVSLCNQADRNSRTSSFKEGGTDVERLNHKRPSSTQDQTQISVDREIKLKAFVDNPVDRLTSEQKTAKEANHLVDRPIDQYCRKDPAVDRQTNINQNLSLFRTLFWNWTLIDFIFFYFEFRFHS